MAGRESGNERDLLDKHFADSSALGTTESRLGNNPMVIAVPRRSGHLVIDMAMSQFSYSALASCRIRGEQLPVEGSFDSDGKLSRDSAAIETSKRPGQSGARCAGRGFDLAPSARVAVAPTRLRAPDPSLARDVCRKTAWSGKC